MVIWCVTIIGVALKKQSSPATRHGGTWGERRYSSYSFLTSALDGGEWSASRPVVVLISATFPKKICFRTHTVAQNSVGEGEVLVISIQEKRFWNAVLTCVPSEEELPEWRSCTKISLVLIQYTHTRGICCVSFCVTFLGNSSIPFLRKRLACFIMLTFHHVFSLRSQSESTFVFICSLVCVICRPSQLSVILHLLNSLHCL
jgi:hypothetical protein